MTPSAEARAHLAKAAEFLDVAAAALDSGRFNAAASNAVASGINAKDAICLKLTARTGKSDSHQHARAELKGSGAAGRAIEPTFGRLLGVKQKSQYEAGSVSKTDAANAVRWAAAMLDAAQQVVTS